MSKRRSTYCPGFTLVELLVVMAIIAVLIAMLLPTLARARDAAAAIRCAANLRQIQMASSMYTGDNQDAIIPSSIYGLTTPSAPTGWVTSNVGLSMGLNNGNYFPGRFPALTRCPASPLEPDAVQIPTLYAANRRIAIDKINHPSNPAERGALRLHEVKIAPSRVIAYFDAGKDRSSVTISIYYPFAPGEVADTAYSSIAGVSNMGYWHPGESANLVALDGHGTTARLTDTTAEAPQIGWWRTFEATGITFDYE